MTGNMWLWCLTEFFYGCSRLHVLLVSLKEKKLCCQNMLSDMIAKNVKKLTESSSVFFFFKRNIYFLFLFFYRHSLYHHGCTKPLWLKKTNWCSVFQNWSEIRFNDHAEKHWKRRFFWPTRIISQQKILKKPLINNPFARASSKQKQTKKQIMTTSKNNCLFLELPFMIWYNAMLMSKPQ